MPVHYHRVVGSFQVVSPAGGTVEILVMDNRSFTKYATAQTVSYLYSSGRAGEGALNFPLHCCIRSGNDDPGEYSQELTYTEYHLVIDNRPSSVSATVRLQVDLLHDGIAVVFLYGEPFAVAELGSLLVTIPAIWSLIMIRRGACTQSVGGLGRKLVLISVGSVAILFLASVTVGGFSATIERTFGENLVADATPYLALFGGSLSILAVAIPWVATIYLRKKDLHRAPRLGYRLAGAVFVAQGSLSVLFWVLLASNYRGILLPMLVLIPIGLLQVPAGLYLIRRARLV